MCRRRQTQTTRRRRTSRVITMSDKPPTKARVLTRLRIDEVSAVDKGAGKGVKVVLMKRDQDDATHPEMPEWERRYWQALGATALRQAEERYAKQNAVEPEPDEDEDKP